ncbi:ABC transporter substrate-binding protein [Vibrio diazotrophicus]|uniref:ABC transporter substrate-binding protein n=1 Tax=Vibrio diazotrophicus TaxID=685 RepID=UPI003D2F5B41
MNMTFSSKFLGLLLLSLAVRAEEVKIYTWEEYISPELIDAYQKETGNSIELVFFENELLRDEVINTGRGNIYDLIIVDSINLQSMYRLGKFHSLASPAITHRENLNHQATVSCGEGGNPYMWGSMGIVYRNSQTDRAVTSWIELFNPRSEHKNKITIPLDDIDTIAAALLALNYDPFTSDQQQLKEAFDLLQNVKPHILAMRNTASYTLEHQQQSEVNIGLAYSGEGYLINEQMQVEDWSYVVPKEGTLIWHECFAAPKGHPIKQATIEFLSFINRPDISAINAESVWYATSNDAAIKLTSDEYQLDSELFPDPEVLERSYLYREIDVKGMKLRNRMISVLNQ